MNSDDSLYYRSDFLKAIIPASNLEQILCNPTPPPVITERDQADLIRELKRVLKEEPYVEAAYACDATNMELRKEVEAACACRVTQPLPQPAPWGKVIEDSVQNEASVKPMILPTQVAGTEQCQAPKVETVSTPEVRQVNSVPENHFNFDYASNCHLRAMMQDFISYIEDVIATRPLGEFEKEGIRIKCRYWVYRFVGGRL